MVPRPVSARVVLTHENGTVSHLHGEWGPDSMPFSTSISIEGADDLVLYSWPNEQDDGAAVGNEPGDCPPAQSPAHSPYTLQNAEFAAAHTSGEPSRVSPCDGVMAVALAEAAYASIASGAAVDFSAAGVKALLD